MFRGDDLGQHEVQPLEQTLECLLEPSRRMLSPTAHRSAGTVGYSTRSGSPLLGSITSSGPTSAPSDATTVPTAERLAVPTMRSPSPWPKSSGRCAATGPLIDQLGRGDQPWRALVGSATTFSQRAAGAQSLGQFPAQRATVAVIERLVDGLVADLSRRPIRVGQP